MSHASLIVALSPEQLQEAGGDLEKAVEYQMQPFYENSEFFADGSRWDWWVIGGRFSGKLQGKDYCLRSELDTDLLRKLARERAADIWRDFQADARKSDPFIREEIYGLSETDTLETLTARMESTPLSAYTFLRNRRWCEGQRMGWFGGSARTECEVKAE
jgi:hypothetical protein